MTKRKASAAADFDSMQDVDPVTGYGQGEVMDLKGIAEVFGMTRYAVKECIARGAPVIHRPLTKLDQWKIAAGNFASWLVRDTLAQDDTPAGRYQAAKTRKIVAEIERVEMVNTESRRSHLTVAEAASLLGAEREVITKHLNAVPANIVQSLATLSPEDRRDPAVVERVIEDVIFAAMVAISSDEGNENVQQAA